MQKQPKRKPWQCTPTHSATYPVSNERAMQKRNVFTPRWKTSREGTDLNSDLLWPPTRPLSRAAHTGEPSQKMSGNGPEYVPWGFPSDILVLNRNRLQRLSPRTHPLDCPWKQTCSHLEQQPHNSWIAEVPVLGLGNGEGGKLWRPLA